MAHYSWQTIAIAAATGILPTILWLLFWLREDRIGNKPKGLFVLCYILGAMMVFLVVPLQRFAFGFVGAGLVGIIIFAAIEELAKYLIINTVALKSSFADRAIDFPMFLICGALGFAALENVFFIIGPISNGMLLDGFITGNIRFLGATLLHAMASGLFGVLIGLSFYRNWQYKPLYVFGGFTLAVLLHSTFNFFIINGNGKNTLQTLAFLWVVAILNILLFEKLKRMNKKDVTTQ
ncbi:MAG: PrsW family intramembrane metalloprotease [Candidatus Pacebacteria bacterium]|nr:PrsW family intramembrane metalloprotease [Candidatus Paceibacterota bacterium]